MALTPKQERFVLEYLVDLNATQAAIRAGYSEATAGQGGDQLLKNIEVRDEIERLKTARSEATKIDANYVLKRLHDENEADLADLYDPDTGALLPVHRWPLIWRKGLIQGVETETIRKAGAKGSGQWRGPAQDVHEPDPDDDEMTIVTKVKISDRIKRTELIGKHVNVQAFADRVDVNVTDNLADRVARAKARANAGE